jgi:hypothetical protein
MLHTLVKLKHAAEIVGLILNKNITKFMKCSRNPTSENKIKIGNTEIESVSAFKYTAATSPINVTEEGIKYLLLEIKPTI